MVRFFLSIVFALSLVACGDDGTGTTDSSTLPDATTDSGRGDGSMDAAPDSTPGDGSTPDGTTDGASEAGMDAMADGTTDGAADATADGAADATADGAADATVDAIADGSFDIGLPDVATGCSSDGDCGAPSCRNMGPNCTQFLPTCLMGTCISRTMRVTGGRCDTTSGMCTGGMVSCANLCDCPQGLICVSGSCLAGIVPEWCCTNAGCPSGDMCTNADGSSGTCP
jgi:hypothetical protein